MGGSEKQTQDVYELSAEVFGSLARDAKGDPDEMEKILEKGALDPESFARKLSPELRKKLHDIAKDLEKSQPLP